MSTILTLFNSMKFSVYPPFPMFPFNLPFSVVVFALLLPNSLCVVSQYDECKNQKCGAIELDFPFRTRGCGLKDFEIDCVDSRPVVQIDGMKYTFLFVYPDMQSFAMVPDQIFQTCSSSWDGNSPKLGSLNSIFSINAISNCSTSSSDVCATYVKSFNSICSSFNWGNLPLEVLTVQWSNYSDLEICQDCNKNNGYCGSNCNPNLKCFSQEGTQQYKCPKGKNKKIGDIVGGVVGGVVGLAFIVFVGCMYLHQKKKKKKKSHPIPDESNLIAKDVENGYSIDQEAGVQTRIGNLPIFSYEILKQATDNFDDNNMLGDGGFGTVYLGKLPDGRTVAVKRMYQDNNRKAEQFINEVKILSSLHHPNLVRLYGCTSPESGDLLLVYEYVPNGTVADHLHGERKGQGLNWDIRLKISLETAQALAFLHVQEPPVLHRDVKTTNILLDENFKVKVADFGLSRFMPPDVTHVSTAPQGTPGYVDPEYYQCFQLTEKSDVYSFGVVLVEMISGKLAVDVNRSRNEISLANMAITKIKDGALHELVDECLEYDSDDKIKAAVTAISELAFSCLQSIKDDRPYMKEIVAQLDQIQKNWSDYGKDKVFNAMAPPSPTSVQDRWASTKTTPNNSG